MPGCNLRFRGSCGICRQVPYGIAVVVQGNPSVSERAAERLFGEEPLSTVEQQYFEMVDRLCENRESLVLSNGSSRHAVYLIYKFLTGAKHAVRLLSGRLLRQDGDIEIFANPVIAEAACSFLRGPGTTLQVLVEGGLDTDESGRHPFIQRIREEVELPGSFDVRTVEGPSLYGMHWMTMDESGYRLEPEPEDIRAHADFNDEEFVSALNSLFDAAFQDATPLPAHT